MKLFCVFLCLSIQCHAYTQTKNVGTVNYGHKESFGMGSPIGLDYNALLVFNSNESTYIFAKDSLEGSKINILQQIDNENETFFIQKQTSEKGKIFNINRKQRLTMSRDVGFNYLKDSLHELNWSITNETKKIGKFKCKKATTSFRGRNYTAWFTTSIPVPYGPWKLHGLPGLILEAYDIDKEIYFYFKSLEYPSTKKINIVVPNPFSENRKWLSFEDYKRTIIKRYKKGVKKGQLLSEEVSTIPSQKHTLPMKNIFIEVFEE